MYYNIQMGGNDMYPLARHTVSTYNPTVPIYSGSQVRLAFICSKGLTASCRKGSIVRGNIVPKHASCLLEESLVANCTHYDEDSDRKASTFEYILFF